LMRGWFCPSPLLLAISFGGPSREAAVTIYWP